MRIMRFVTWLLCILAVGAAMVIYQGVGGVEFRSDFGDYVVNRLIALGVIAAVVERALEVLIEPWRGPGKGGLNDDRLAAYRGETRFFGLAAGTAFGLLIAALGVRLIEPMAEDAVWAIPADLIWVLRTVDVLLVGLLIGGGSDALHQLVSVVIDFLGKTRTRINTTAP